jgi:hypothetical protein
MKRCRTWIVACLIALSAAAWGVGGEPSCQESTCFLQRLGPVGGWHPYGTTMLHWWPEHCFPCAGAPDDYCPKPLPRVCWPPYPPYYIWGPPEICYPQARCKDCGGSH